MLHTFSNIFILFRRKGVSWNANRLQQGAAKPKWLGIIFLKYVKGSQQEQLAASSLSMGTCITMKWVQTFMLSDFISTKMNLDQNYYSNFDQKKKTEYMFQLFLKYICAFLSDPSPNKSPEVLHLSQIKSCTVWIIASQSLLRGTDWKKACTTDHTEVHAGLTLIAQHYQHVAQTPWSDTTSTLSSYYVREPSAETCRKRTPNQPSLSAAEIRLGQPSQRAFPFNLYPALSLPAKQNAWPAPEPAHASPLRNFFLWLISPNATSRGRVYKAKAQEYACNVRSQHRGLRNPQRSARHVQSAAHQALSRKQEAQPPWGMTFGRASAQHPRSFHWRNGPRPGPAHHPRLAPHNGRGHRLAGPHLLGRLGEGGHERVFLGVLHLLGLLQLVSDGRIRHRGHPGGAAKGTARRQKKGCWSCCCYRRLLPAFPHTGSATSLCNHRDCSRRTSTGGGAGQPHASPRTLTLNTDAEAGHWKPRTRSWRWPQHGYLEWRRYSAAGETMVRQKV